jgi:hypothetical protein
MTPARRRAELSRAECLQLVSSVPFGRVVFTVRALPAISPVSHLVAGAQIIIRASLGAAFSSAPNGNAAVVAYQADLIDPGRRAGWSVVIIGRAHRVTSEAHAARYRQALPPWTDGEMDEVIAIDADLVTGIRIVPVPALAGLG